MQQTPSPLPDDYIEIAEKVRTGEYFNEAQTMYDLWVHDPMAERYLYICITALAMLSFVVAASAVKGLFPLQQAVAFVVTTNNIVEDVPHISPLEAHKGDNPDEAMIRFLVSNYTELREGYDIEDFEHNVNGVRSQSTEEVFNTYQKEVDPHNPESPIALYQRHTKRKIKVLTARPNTFKSMEVFYDATLESKGDVKKSRWVANISFSYVPIGLDEKTGLPKPVQFVVTKYSTKRIQEE